MNNSNSDESLFGGGSYGAFELVWFFICVWIVSLFFHRFTGETWFGYHPSAGSIILLLLVAIPIGLSASTPVKKGIRIGVPVVLVYLIFSQIEGPGGAIERFQNRVGLAHFLLVFVSTFAAVLLTSKEEEELSPLLGEEEEDFVKPPSTGKSNAFDRIIGQGHVVAPLKEISNIARSGIRVGKSNAPHAVLLFLGPTGVGKTEAARALAEAVYGSEDSLIRFDMGQFTDAHQANRFYGPPPGYVGSDKGGQLTQSVLKNPRSVVLLDEVEKAHPQIWDAFLPVFDEGYIVDGSFNQRVDMTNTVIVLTSNLLADNEGVSGLPPYELKEAVQATGAFRAELLGRINEILLFKPLDSEAIRKILKLRLESALWGLSEQGISITVDDAQMAGLVDQLKAAKFGVRQIDDVVRKFLRKAIAEARGSEENSVD